MTNLSTHSLADVLGGGNSPVLSRLESKREELVDTLRKLRADGLDADRAAEPLENAINACNREQRAGEIQRATATLTAVNWAIARWGLGCGDVCVRCNEDISAKRLTALPWASRCVTCQEAPDDEQ